MVGSAFSASSVLNGRSTLRDIRPVGEERLTKTQSERGSSMDIGAQRIFAWGALVSLLMAIFGLYMAGFLPPPSPAESAEQIATLYRTNSDSICIGAILFLFPTPPFLLFIGCFLFPICCS